MAKFITELIRKSCAVHIRFLQVFLFYFKSYIPRYKPYRSFVFKDFYAGYRIPMCGLYYLRPAHKPTKTSSQEKFSTKITSTKIHDLLCNFYTVFIRFLWFLLWNQYSWIIFAMPWIQKPVKLSFFFLLSNWKEARCHLCWLCYQTHTIGGVKKGIYNNRI